MSGACFRFASYSCVWGYCMPTMHYYRLHVSRLHTTLCLLTFSCFAFDFVHFHPRPPFTALLCSLFASLSLVGIPKRPMIPYREPRQVVQGRLHIVQTPLPFLAFAPASCMLKHSIEQASNHHNAFRLSLIGCTVSLCLAALRRSISSARHPEMKLPVILCWSCGMSDLHPIRSSLMLQVDALLVQAA